LCASSGAIGTYYWSRGDSQQLPARPLLTAMKNTIVYHMGSIAFGALIIAIIQFIRCATVVYAQHD
jgi:choline transporter-like protein 2/4/5